MKKNKIKNGLVALLAIFVITPSLSAMQQLLTKCQIQRLQTQFNHPSKNVFLQKSNKKPISYLMEYIERDNIYGKAYVYINPETLCMGPDIEGEGLVIYRAQDHTFWLTGYLEKPGRPANKEESLYIQLYCGHLDQDIEEIDETEEDIEDPFFVFDCNPNFLLHGDECQEELEELSDDVYREVVIKLPENCGFSGHTCQPTRLSNDFFKKTAVLHHSYNCTAGTIFTHNGTETTIHVFMDRGHNLEVEFSLTGKKDKFNNPILLIWQTKVSDEDISSKESIPVNIQEAKETSIKYLTFYLDKLKRYKKLLSHRKKPLLLQRSEKEISALITRVEAKLEAINALSFE